MGDEEELGNVGSEQDSSVRSECKRGDGYFKDTKAETYDRNGEYKG
jgi:hypothetical protein